jgi:hypothetical protein
VTNTFANKTAERLTAISTNLIGSSRWCKPVFKKLDVVDAWAASKNLTHPYPQASVDRKEIEALFVHILQLAREMGVLKMGTIGLDGTKIHANASRHSALSYEHAGKIEEQLKAEVAISWPRPRRTFPMACRSPTNWREQRLRGIAEARAKIEVRTFRDRVT